MQRVIRAGYSSRFVFFAKKLQYLCACLFVSVPVDKGKLYGIEVAISPDFGEGYYIKTTRAIDEGVTELCYFNYI